MNTLEEPKYGINMAGQFYNRVSGETIPNDEPVCILRADQDISVTALERYYALCKNESHRLAISQRIDDFHHYQYRTANNHSVKEESVVPIMVFRARDTNAAMMLDYCYNIARGVMRDAIEERLRVFNRFAAQYPDRMKEPTTDLTGEKDDR